MKKKIYGFRRGLIALCAVMGIAQLSSAQVGVGISSPDPSAQLQIESTTKGLLIPRVTNTSVVPAPATGLIVYQTGGTAGFYYNKGTSLTPNWLRVADETSVGLADEAVTNAKVAPSAAIAYSKLNLANSIWNADIQANAITTSKVANGAVTTSKIADSAISGLKLLSNAVTNAHVANGALNPAKLSTSGASTGQTLMYNGAGIVWGNADAVTASYGFATANDQVIAVVLGGTNVPLDNNQRFNNVIVDGSNTSFTINQTGTYRIEYNINESSATYASSRIMINGAEENSSVIESSTATNKLQAFTIVTLAAGDVINLQLYGMLGAVTLQSGQGAALSIQKL